MAASFRTRGTAAGCGVRTFLRGVGSGAACYGIRHSGVFAVRIKQRPEDFDVAESFRFDEDPRGRYRVYLMDKQKLSTLDAIERLRERFKLKRDQFSICGLKDKQGRTKQLIGVEGADIELQDADLRL